uniref:Peptidase M14 domain-containing protein n=1 Tax=Glossina morsitans morsitans TaxID=37546 RepID=A0A1B0FDR9_GLOMM
MDQIIKNSARVVTGFDIGRSYEGRLIRGVKLSFKPGRKAIFIESNIHAREWITSAACTYLIMELLYSRDPDVRELAESLDWWIIPVLNVDGFVYSHEKERLWRKSRRPASPDCIGIDLNRNFNYKWALRRNADPYSNVYSGPHPESEPEVQQLIEFINNNIPEGSIKIYVALHSAAQAFGFMRGKRFKTANFFPDRRSLFPKKRPTYRVLDWTFYPTLCEIYSWMDFIIKERPNVVTGFDVGRSYEGRLIRGLRLSFKPDKKAIFIESNIHAREWITSAACTYLIMELLFSINPDVRELAESLDWWIVPVLNVDGFVYSHEKERLWRKSRKPVSSNCVGVDLNRNFNYKWEIRRCADPSSNTYSGPSAESEPEVENLANFISNYIPKDSIKIYVALHSPLQAVHLPWSHTKVPPKNYEDLLYVANAFAEALHSRYGTKYHCGSSANLLSRMLNNYFLSVSSVKVSLNLDLFSGGSKDWAYGEKNIPIAYTIELPGKGRPSPYDLPQSSILRTSAEFLDGFIGMIRAVKKLDRRNLFPKNRPTYRLLDWTFYPTLCEIYSWMDFIIKECPRVVTGFDIGRSYEGRLIRGLKLSFKPGKKAIFIESNIHAREWITSAACTYLIMELLFSIDPDVRELAESLDWWIVPVLNVDGFVYSHEKERLWRKTRRPATDGDCVGVDLNRNFNFKWGHPCSILYSGPYPHSEPEVAQLTKFINNNIPEGSIKIYVALHSPAQAVLTPWTHTRVPPKSYGELMYVANAFADALYRRYHTRYDCGNSGMFSGGSKDWAFSVKHVPIAYTIELPGKGKPSPPFELPESAILRTSAEMLDGFIGMIKAVKELGYI